MEKKNKKIQKDGKVKKAVVKKKPKEKVITDLEGNVIPKEKVVKPKMKDKLKAHVKKYKKIYKIVLFTILAIVLISLIYLGVRNYMLYKRYGKYEKAMNRYGFDRMYTNESAKSYEKVTKLDMVKLVLASVFNTTEIENYGFAPTGEFEGDEWARTAIAYQIVEKDYITKDNYDETATYMEAIEAYLKARSKLCKIEVKSTKESSFKNLQSYTQEQRAYINDAAENGLIENSNKKLKANKEMFKGEFNELIVKFVEKYNTMIPEGETLVTKEESKPSNYEIYPYILYSVDKKVYEYECDGAGEPDFKTPAETYSYEKDRYSQMQYRSEHYYNTILNVDYTKIDKEAFKEEAEKYLRYDYDEEIYEYVDYVIANKIVMEGKAKVQLPVFYLDSIRFRARVRLDFEIKSANTDTNLILGDLTRGTDVKYTLNNKYTVYIDLPMGTTLYSRALYIDMEPTIDIMVSEKKSENEI